jgi:hypothetical protein
MKSISDLTLNGNAKITLTVIALYSAIGVLTYFMWS